MRRYDLINYLIKTRQYTNYLEVGTQFTENNYDRIECKNKECIDPDPKSDAITYKMTSDEAFKLIHDKGLKYDIIFIDGLHETNQVDRDIANSLRALNENGVIVMHDCNPPTGAHVTGFNGDENGDVYKSIIKLRTQRPDLSVCVVDMDWGCGIVSRGRQELFSPDVNDRENILTFPYFAKHRRQLLNLITVAEFFELFRPQAQKSLSQYRS